MYKGYEKSRFSTNISLYLGKEYKIQAQLKCNTYTNLLAKGRTDGQTDRQMNKQTDRLNTLRLYPPASLTGRRRNLLEQCDNMNTCHTHWNCRVLIFNNNKRSK